MALDFPSSPTNGQVYEQYVYDSSVSAWRSKGGAVAATYTSDTAPSGAVKGDMWYRTSDGTTFVYVVDADTSQWVEIRSQISLARVGLVPVAPTSVVVGSGTASVNSGGSVTFSGASTISLNGVFTSSYKNYKIIIADSLYTSIDGAVIGLRFRTAGTSSAVNYYFNGFYQQGTSTTGVSAGSNQTQWNMTNAYTNLYNFCDMDVYQPFGAQKTLYKGTFQSYGSSGGLYVSHTGLHDQTVSYDGFTITMSSGTVNGTVFVYGYN